MLCRVGGRDRTGHGLGTCRAGGAELNAGLVTTGWALAGDAPAITGPEAQAGMAERRLWTGGFTRLEAWRRS